MAEHNESGKSMLDVDLEDIKNEGRNYITLDSEGKPVPIFCRHCDEPECVSTCMSGAMAKDKDSGLVSYDKEKCASCFMCVMSCPYGVLKPDTKSKTVVVKCDMCNGREIPRCVENCPTGAIYLEEVDA
jgi:carbon-monoxide dehydrogenase iron sulfur subunit